MQHTDLQTEIRKLQLQLKNKEQLFDFGMSNEKEFGEMKELYLEIKQLKQNISHLLEKAGRLQNTPSVS